MPISYNEIEKLFGKFNYYSKSNGTIVIDPQWIKENIVSLNLPIIGTIRCHKKVASDLSKIFSKIEFDTKQYLININDFKKLGGCFVPRHIRFNPKKKLSLHSWGIAIDLNVKDNPFGTKGTENQKELSRYFIMFGWEWGGNWKTPDPMHFQYNKPKK